MPAKAHTQVPANPKTGPLLERLIRERRPMLERIAARTVRQDQVEDAIQAACLGFLRTFDPDASTGGMEGAFRYLATSVDNSAAKIIRSEGRRLRGLPPAGLRDDRDDPVERAESLSPGPMDQVIARSEVTEQLASIAKLPQDQQKVLLDRAAGFTPTEVAERRGLTVRQYRKRIEKARRRLSQ